MGDIIERLNNLNDIEDLKKIVKEVLKRDLTNEELSLIENEDDEIIENLLREITQELEKNIPEEGKENFYINLDSYLLKYANNDNAKLERIPSMNGLGTFEIISSMANMSNKIKAVNLIQDDNQKEFIIQRLGRDFLKEYMKSSNRAIADFALEPAIAATGDREIIKDYMKANPQANKVYLIRSIEDKEFIKECLTDENLGLSKEQRIDLIRETKDVELTKKAVYDESLELTNNEKVGLLENVNDIKLISTYIHDENCSLSESDICGLIQSTEDSKFIKDCILDNTLEINRTARIDMIQSVNKDIEIVQEIIDSPDLELNEREKTNIVEQTRNVPFIEKFLEAEEKNLEGDNKLRLLYMVQKDSEFIKKLIRENRMIEQPQDKLYFIVKTEEQEFIKECIYDKNTNWAPTQIQELIASIEDESFVEKCFQDEQLNLQTEDIFQILRVGKFSQDFLKRWILNPELNVGDDKRYDLVLECIRDDQFVLEIVRDEKIDIGTWKKLKLLGKIQEPVFSENIEEIMAILKQNGENYKKFRNESETPEGIYNNIDQFFDVENVELKNRQKYKEILGRMFQKNEEVVKKIDFRMLDSKYIDSLGEDKINQISCYPEIQQKILGMDDKTYIIFSKCLNNRAKKNERWTTFASDIIENLTSGQYTEVIQNCDLENINIENLSSILQSKNLFNITNTEEVNNINNIRREICDKIMSGQLQEMTGEILKSYSELDKKRFAVLEKIFGQDIDKTQFIISAYGEDIEKLDDKEENKEIIDYIKALKLIMQEENEEILSGMYKEADIVSNINTELMETKLKSAYCEKLNEGLFQITEATEKVGKNIYEAGTNFSMIITSVAAYRYNQPENYERDWNKKLIGTQHFCTSYIRNDMMGIAPVEHLCYGFFNMKPDSLMLAGSEDMASSEDKMKTSTLRAEREKYYTPDDLVNKTESHNELDFARYQDGQKKQPDYIVVFRKNGKIENWDKAIKAQKEWGDLPIVIVDQDKCLNNERNKVHDLLKKFNETSDPQALEDTIQKIRNNRQTDEKFCKQINIEKLKKQSEELKKREENIPKKINEQVTLKDLEENYEMVDAMDRKKETSKISQIYIKLKQVQREGAGYEL